MGMEAFIWYEKWRPHSLADMSLPDQYRKNFAGYLEGGEIPHLLLYGPQGSGKTTLGFILMDSIPCSKLILNASSGDRGIEVMRTKVKQFAASQTIDGRLKIVFLDEADGLTVDAQQALKNTIEMYSKTCRFIFTANEVDKIIGPVQSRCTLFEFAAFPIEQVIQLCQGILGKEQIEYELTDLQKIVSQHYPDVRSVINNLQLCAVSGTLDPAAVSRVAIDPEALIDCIVDGQVAKIRTMLVGISNFVYLYRYLMDVLLSLDDLSPDEKVEVVHVISEHLFRDASIANREINFVDCAISIMGVIKCPSISFM